MAAAIDWLASSPEHDASPRLVVLLHGFASTPHTLAFLARHVRERLKRPVLRPPLGLGFGDLVRAAECAHDAIVRAGAREVDVVGHSLGGLVASYLLKRIDRGRRVRRVITLGAPHGGAPLARLGALATFGFAPALRQLVPGSRFLADLAATEVPAASELVALAGEADALVPEHCALLDTRERQRSQRLAHVDHMQLVFHSDVLTLVGELLGAAEGRPATRSRVAIAPRPERSSRRRPELSLRRAAS